MKKALLASTLFIAFGAYAEEEAKPFTMDGEFGLIVTTGNTKTTSVKGRVSAHQELESWSNDYVAEALYKKDQVINSATQEEETQTTAQEYFLSAQGNYKLENPDHR